MAFGYVRVYSCFWLLGANVSDDPLPHESKYVCPVLCAGPLIQNGSYQSRPTGVGACPLPSDREDIEVDVLQLLSAQYGLRPLGLSPSYPAESCDQIEEANPNPRDGEYWIRMGEDVTQMRCTF